MQLPLSGEENKCIRDAAGHVVSTWDYADVFARIANERAALHIFMERIARAKSDQHVQVPWLAELVAALRAAHPHLNAEAEQREIAGNGEDPVAIRSAKRAVSTALASVGARP
jgi:hypothetical protein